MMGLQCVVDRVKETGSVDWGQCDVCLSWYHCGCVGMAVTKESEFVCCSDSVNNRVYVCYYLYSERLIILH